MEIIIKTIDNSINVKAFLKLIFLLFKIDVSMFSNLGM